MENMEITNYFETTSKKREFLNRGSSSSNDDDVSKRVKENENPSSSSGNVTDGNVGSTETVNKLVSCMEQVQKQIALIFQNTNDLRDNQIKGTRQYDEIQESLQAISDRFDDYEADRKKKDETINRLENEVSVLNVKVSELTSAVEKQEQYSRRNCLLLHGINENKDEDTDKISLNTLNENLQLELTELNIERSHRIGKPKPNGKPRPIIIKFVRYNVRRKVHERKKMFKGKKISITESLTAFRMSKLAEAREKYGFLNVWTSDGRVLYKDGGKVNLYFD